MDYRPAQSSRPTDTDPAYMRSEPPDQPPALQQARQQAGQVMDQARSQALSQLEQQKQRASGGLGNVAQALRQTGEQLRQQEHSPLAQYADRAAVVVERASGYLDHHDARQLINEVERFARSQPALFLGGAFTLGLFAARFLKSSGDGTGANAPSYRAEPYSGWAETAPGLARQSTYPSASASYAAPAIDDTGAPSVPVTTEPMATATDEEEEEFVSPVGRPTGGRLSDDQRS